MEWYYVSDLKSTDLINEFERLIGYTFCDSFKKFVMQYNGACAHPDGYSTFDTEESVGHLLAYFLSFNMEDPAPIWNSRNWDDCGTGMKDEYVVFADTCFGDSIAFDKSDDSVVFINHETLNVEKIADDFDGFLNSLYIDPGDE